MPILKVRALAEGLPFGARVRGVTSDDLADEAVRNEIKELFEAKGLIVFEDVEPDERIHLEISRSIGPLLGEGADSKGGTDRAQNKVLIDPGYDGLSEVDGVPMMNFLPWHFDQCYSSTLTRGGVLRAMSVPPVGGMTGFADGFQLYEGVSADLRDRFEALNILYDGALIYWRMKFGRPQGYRPLKIRKTVIDQLSNRSLRSIHPAIWTRPTGEKVLHISPMQAAGIEGMETPEGDALLEAMCQEIYGAMLPYYHRWKPTDLVAWDNSRFIHCVTGHPPEYSRDMRRTIIFGDYRLGRREEPVD